MNMQMLVHNGLLKNNEVVYFDSFCVEHVHKEIKDLLDIET